MTGTGGTEPASTRSGTRAMLNVHDIVDVQPDDAVPDDAVSSENGISSENGMSSENGVPGEDAIQAELVAVEPVAEDCPDPRGGPAPVRGGLTAQPMFAATREESDAVVSAAVRGERVAVDRLLKVIRPLIVRYCRSRLGRPERSFASADDVAQEVCVAVLRALPKYRDQGRPFLAFVYGIAAHKVADAHRSAQRNRSEPHEEVPDAPDDGRGPEHAALAGELSTRMSKLLEELPDKQREIVVLRVMMGMSAEETADTVGSTPGAVRVAQHRALSRLRGLLSAQADY